MYNIGSIVLDIAGYELNPEDRELLQHPQVAGLILFARNYSSRKQLCALVREVRAIKPDCIIMVDHEGGRVQRFLTDFARLPAATHYGELYDSEGS